MTDTREMQGRRDAGETYDSRTPTTDPRRHATLGEGGSQRATTNREDESLT